MGKHKRRKKNRRRRLTKADKILIAAMLNTLIAILQLLLDD